MESATVLLPTGVKQPVTHRLRQIQLRCVSVRAGAAHAQRVESADQVLIGRGSPGSAGPGTGEGRTGDVLPPIAVIPFGP
jgi:hypothetical protein